MIQEDGPGLNDPPAEPATPPNGKRKFSFEPTPTKKKKDDVREFTLGQFKERTKKGQYMAVDLSGSEYKIHKADCFLQACGLKLSDGERFYELARNPGLGQHMAKTKSQMHFNEICAAVIDHCKGALSLPFLAYGSQLTFRIAQISPSLSMQTTDRGTTCTSLSSSISTSTSSPSRSRCV